MPHRRKKRRNDQWQWRETNLNLILYLRREKRSTYFNFDRPSRKKKCKRPEEDKAAPWCICTKCRLMPTEVEKCLLQVTSLCDINSKLFRRRNQWYSAYRCHACRQAGTTSPAIFRRTMTTIATMLTNNSFLFLLHKNIFPKIKVNDNLICEMGFHVSPRDKVIFKKKKITLEYLIYFLCCSFCVNCFVFVFWF